MRMDIYTKLEHAWRVIDETPPRIIYGGRRWYLPYPSGQHIWAHMAYCAIRLDHDATMTCLFRWHSDLVWC